MSNKPEKNVTVSVQIKSSLYSVLKSSAKDSGRTPKKEAAMRLVDHITRFCEITEIDNCESALVKYRAAAGSHKDAAETYLNAP